MDKKKIMNVTTLIKYNKAFEAYKKKEDLMLNYQMAKAYYKDSGCSVSGLCERILKEKYNLPWQEKLIRKALAEVKGKKGAVLTIPQFKFQSTVYDILSNFVHKKFDKMVGELIKQPHGTIYPLTFRDIVEKNC